MKKFKVEVIADSSGKWCSNALVYDTHEAAEEAGANLAGRWMAVREWRVVEATIERKEAGLTEEVES